VVAIVNNTCLTLFDSSSSGSSAVSVQCSGGVDGIAAAAAGWCAGDRALRRGTDAMGRGFEFKVYDSSDPDYQARQHNVAREPLRCDDRVEDFCLVLLKGSHISDTSELRQAWRLLWACLRSEEGCVVPLKRCSGMPFWHAMLSLLRMAPLAHQ
jgi:hypothetical protein